MAGLEHGDVEVVARHVGRAALGDPVGLPSLFPVARQRHVQLVPDAGQRLRGGGIHGREGQRVCGPRTGAHNRQDRRQFVAERERPVVALRRLHHHVGAGILQKQRIADGVGRVKRAVPEAAVEQQRLPVGNVRLLDARFGVEWSRTLEEFGVRSRPAALFRPRLLDRDAVEVRPGDHRQGGFPRRAFQPDPDRDEPLAAAGFGVRVPAVRLARFAHLHRCAPEDNVLSQSGSQEIEQLRPCRDVVEDRIAERGELALPALRLLVLDRAPVAHEGRALLRREQPDRAGETPRLERIGIDHVHAGYILRSGRVPYLARCLSENTMHAHKTIFGAVDSGAPPASICRRDHRARVARRSSCPAASP